MGQKWQRLLVAEMMPVQTAWLTLCELFPDPAAKLPVQFRYQNISISDWLENLRTDDQQTVSIMQIASKVCNTKGELRADKVIDIWIRQLVAASLNYPVTFYLVARDASLCMPPLAQAAATATLETLIAFWRAGLDGILPVACKTALALIAGDNPQQTYDGGYNMSGEVESPYLARCGLIFLH
jgi:exodeoxyribonuclease V gamma subunit